MLSHALMNACLVKSASFMYAPTRCEVILVESSHDVRMDRHKSQSQAWVLKSEFRLSCLGKIHVRGLRNEMSVCLGTPPPPWNPIHTRTKDVFISEMGLGQTGVVLLCGKVLFF